MEVMYKAVDMPLIADFSVVIINEDEKADQVIRDKTVIKEAMEMGMIKTGDHPPAVPTTEREEELDVAEVSTGASTMVVDSAGFPVTRTPL